MKIKFIGHSYHQTTHSSGFFIKILESFGEIDYMWDESWIKPTPSNEFGDLSPYDLIVVWQLPHIAKKIPNNLKQKTVFVPMYDAVENLDGKFWRKLRGVRVLCLSMATYIKTRRYKIESIYCQYYTPTCDHTPKFERLRLFFWQRQTTPNWRTIAASVPMTQFDSIHLHRSVDPGAGAFIQPLPTEIEKFNITVSDWFSEKNDYFLALEKSNVFIAPRKSEGIGMALLEALARGLVCVAYDAPTMNEYIVDGMNGYLMNKDPSCPVVIDNPEYVSKNAQHYYKKGRSNYEDKLPVIHDFLKKPSDSPFHPVFDRIKEKKDEIFGHSGRMQSLIMMAEAFSNRKRPKRPRVSVVTVVRNDAKGLERTLRSIFAQTYPEFELTVVDGASQDDTVKLLSRMEFAFDAHISEPDKGPYDAMHKGAKISSGDLVIYMNAGDEFFDQYSLQEAMNQCPEEADIVYGHHMYFTKKGRPEFHRANWLLQTYDRLVKGNIDRHWLSGIPCHQSTLVRRNLLIARGFNWEKYPIAADHDLLFDLVGNGAITYHTNTTISIYYGGGLSSKRGKQCASDWKGIALHNTSNPEAVEEFYGDL